MYVGTASSSVRFTSIGISEAVRILSDGARHSFVAALQRGFEPKPPPTGQGGKGRPCGARQAAEAPRGRRRDRRRLIGESSRARHLFPIPQELHQFFNSPEDLRVIRFHAHIPDMLDVPDDIVRIDDEDRPRQEL